MKKSELEQKIKDLEKELRSQKANIIRELKKNHPKGFCYICGKGKRTTIHHLREMNTRKRGKVNGIIPLCRDCHDGIETLKSFKHIPVAVKRGKEKRTNQILGIMEKWWKDQETTYTNPEDASHYSCEIDGDDFEKLKEKVRKTGEESK